MAGSSLVLRAATTAEDKESTMLTSEYGFPNDDPRTLPCQADCGHMADNWHRVEYCSISRCWEWICLCEQCWQELRAERRRETCAWGTDERDDLVRQCLAEEELEELKQLSHEEQLELQIERNLWGRRF